MAGQMSTTRAKEIARLMTEGVVRVVDPKTQKVQCTVCNLTVTGNTPLDQHLAGASHREAGARKALTNPTSAPASLRALLQPATLQAAVKGVITLTTDNNVTCTTCDVMLSGVRPTEDHLRSDGHKRRASFAQLPPPVMQQANAFVPVNPMDEVVRKAIDQKVIIHMDNRDEPFFCLPCQKKFNSSGPLHEHLKSNKHKNKASSIAIGHAPRDIGPDLRQQEDQVGAPHQYNVISQPRGLVYVFNYTFTGQIGNHRIGAEHDSRNLSDTFTRMGYEVLCHKDLSGMATREELNRIVRNPKLATVDSLILIFLSHGLDAYTFKANDSTDLHLHELRSMFTDHKCPHMKGKPKIIFANYCRGQNIQRKFFDTVKVEVPQNMVTVHAAAEGIMAQRSETGTFFVKSLCTVLSRHARAKDLRVIYHELNEEMKKSNATNPMWEDYTFKQFYFNPV